MHTVLAFKGKLIASVVFMHHFYIGSKRMLTIPDHMSWMGNIFSSL